MLLTQTPSPLPDAGALKDLDYRVALALIIAGVLLAFLTYFGGPIRDRIAKKPDPAPATTPPPAPDPPSTPGNTQLLPATAAGPAVDAVTRAERRTDQFIDNLLRQIQEAADREDGFERRIQQLERRLSELENENQRLHTLLWQRGSGR